MFILRGLYRIFETIHDYALEELYDIQGIKQKLVELQLLLDIGEINDEEYSIREKGLIQQLNDARDYHGQLLDETNDDDQEDMEYVGSVPDFKQDNE